MQCCLIMGVTPIHRVSEFYDNGALALRRVAALLGYPAEVTIIMRLSRRLDAADYAGPRHRWALCWVVGLGHRVLGDS